ncbi:2'-5' RNA ligase family protein [Dongshaea marina]|uniref:2'-5' RNA ligase family protein n=1 Tax=Dongshaea marina TaxID=2047966 RepID=UPI000D3E790B|nr:2'-5' RNA ligase family protein [Dongshaea marina]
MFRRMMLVLVLLGFGITQAMAGNVTYNVFLIPEKSVDQTVGKISQQLKKEQLNSLYSQGYLPHITLYLTEYPANHLESIKKQVQQLASQWKPFEVKLDRIERTKGDWLMLNVERSRQLQRLADSATLAVEPLRAMDPTLPGWVAKYPGKLAAFKRYGSPNVFINFQPHITLLPQSDSNKLDRFMLRYGNGFKPLSFKVLGIGIAKVNSNGQAKQDLATYYFKQ